MAEADVIEARKWALGVLWGASWPSLEGKPIGLIQVLPWAEMLAQWALTGQPPSEPSVRKP